MSVAAALVAGNDPLPQLAEQALRLALEKAGEQHANGVLLFLTAEFSRHAQQAVTAVARAARCTQVAGGIAAGVFTDSGWVLDRPAAAVMVFTGGISLGHPETVAPSAEALLSYAGSTLPQGWTAFGQKRFGGSFASHAGRLDPVAWQQSRLTDHCSVQLLGAHVEVGVSTGWRLLGAAQPVDSSRAYELLRLGGHAALDSLLAAVRENGHVPPPMTSLCAVLVDDAAGSETQRQFSFANGAHHLIAIIASSQQGSLTLAERVAPGQRLAWAIRLPHAAAEDMRRSVARLAAVAPDPVGAVAFSCIGRGPYFYDGDDRDIDCLRERFPGLPLIGTYGTGQIAPSPARGMLQNAVVTALISQAARRSDVQSQP